MGLNDVDFIGAITDPDQCEDAIRAGSDARRRMSIMSGEGTVDRALGWWSRIKRAALPFVKRLAVRGVNALAGLAIRGINSL